jgi:predicted nucleotidyltransferase
MIETGQTSKLETHRFVISPESRTIIDDLKKYIKNLKEQYKEIAGISFFGSRTVGMNGSSSDLDFVIFLDTSDLYIENSAKRNQLRELIGSLKDFLESKQVRVDSIQTRDIKMDQLNRDVNEFMSDVDKGKQFNESNFKFLMELFYLGSGVGLYKARKLVLDKFERTSGGERYFKRLMELLKHRERDVRTTKRPHGLPAPTKNGISAYPETISEARKYFFIK